MSFFFSAMVSKNCYVHGFKPSVSTSVIVHWFLITICINFIFLFLAYSSSSNSASLLTAPQFQTRTPGPDLKSYDCPHCRYSTCISSNMKKHIQIHTGVKPYKCDYCDKRFIQKTNLKRHLRTHNDSTIHTCRMCLMDFSARNDLDCHIRTHFKE